MQRWSGIPSFRHYLLRHVSSHGSWWALAALVSLRENILVLLKVNASISTKSAWKRLWRRLDFPSDGDWAGHPATDMPGDTDMPLNGIWGQLECCSWGAGLGLQVHSDCSSFPATPQGAARWPCPMAGAADGRVRLPTLHSLAKWAACYLLPGPAPDPVFAH